MRYNGQKKENKNLWPDDGKQIHYVQLLEIKHASRWRLGFILQFNFYF